MKLRGGYDILLRGRPSGEVRLAPEPDTLYLPLSSRRFSFSELCVTEGEAVQPGQALARDPDQYAVPLLAPRAGTVRLGTAEGHVTLENVAKAEEEPYDPSEDLPHVPANMGSAGMKPYKLLSLGAWQFLRDARTGALPDPFGTPQAVIVSTVSLEPFLARGDVQIRKRLASFTRGLEHLQSLLEYQPIYLALPDVKSELATKVREILRGYAWVQLTEVPLCYPHDHSALLARRLASGADQAGPIWAVGVAGVLAFDRALTLSRPSTVRIVSVGGPGTAKPCHVKAMPGYPLRSLIEPHVKGGSIRVVNGAVLSGTAVSPETLGLDVECEGLTLLPEQTEREFLGFVRPGADRRSYSRCFLSVLGRPAAERLTTALRGEGRACVACGYCEEVCPARIMPHLIHKYLYQDALEDVERCRVDLCIGCGLCAYVCPSKIELTKQFADAQETIQLELHPEETTE